MTDAQTERIRRYAGTMLLTLKDDGGNEEQFRVKPLRTKDIAEVLSSFKQLNTENFTGAEVAAAMSAMGRVSAQCLMRSMDGLTEDEAENIVSNNFNTFFKIIMDQLEKMSELTGGKSVKGLRMMQGATGV